MLENQVKEKRKYFDEKYFDSGNYVIGAYDYYSFNVYSVRFEPLSQVIKKHFNPKRVLDIGCAKGSFVYAFREVGIEAFGVDVSEYAISCAPMSLQRFLRVIDLDKDCLPYKDNFFDFITFFGSIEFLQNHRKIIEEMERVLKVDGSLLLTTIYRKPKNDFYRINVHSKRFWLKEFRGWQVSEAYYDFMSDYFQSSVNLRRSVSGAKRLLFGRSRFSDKFFVFLWDVLVSLRVLGYGMLLLTLRKKAVD